MVKLFWYSEKGHLVRIGLFILAGGIGYAVLEGTTPLPTWLLIALMIVVAVTGVWLNFAFWGVLRFKKGFATNLTSFDFALDPGKPGSKPIYIIWNDIDSFTWDKNQVHFKFKNEAELIIHKEVQGFSALMLRIPEKIAGEEHKKIKLVFDKNYEPL
ncbi:MAG TPA: hypothetical protein VD905_20675, partial [Flavobacteriales bacterium]|nr:hypothetical protein [Flavobacteriales bacterium]